MPTLPSDSISEGQEFFSLFYIGINIEDILYGIELFLYFKTIRILLRNGGLYKRVNLFYALFSSMMLFSVTVWVATQAMFGEKMWLLEYNFPGGPGAYWRKYIAIWYIDWGTTAMIILQLMTDALMIFRCRVIWNSRHVVAVPIILWLASFALGISVDLTTSSPGGDYFTGISVPLSLSYWSVSVILNMTLTCLICYRMVRHGRKIKEQLGHEYASLYFSVVTIIVESVLPYTLSGVAALVSLGVGSPTSVTFVAVYSLMMCISPQMLILRVVTGKAWGNDASNQPVSTVIFNHGTVATSARLQLPDNDRATAQVHRSSSVDGHGKARSVPEV